MDTKLAIKRKFAWLNAARSQKLEAYHPEKEKSQESKISSVPGRKENTRQRGSLGNHRATETWHHLGEPKKVMKHQGSSGEGSLILSRMTAKRRAQDDYVVTSGEWLAPRVAYLIIVDTFTVRTLRASLPVTHTASSCIATSFWPLHLWHVLVSPHINLLSMHSLTRDNSVSIEFDHDKFSIKYLQTKAMILWCESSSDLYHLPACLPGLCCSSSHYS